MERMLKRIAIRKDGTISMSEFRNFAEKYQGKIDKLEEENKALALENVRLKDRIITDENFEEKLDKENKKLKERIDILYEFIERNDKLVDEVIDEEDLDKLNRYIYIDDDLVDRTLESED